MGSEKMVCLRAGRACQSMWFFFFWEEQQRFMSQTEKEEHKSFSCHIFKSEMIIISSVTYLLEIQLKDILYVKTLDDLEMWGVWDYPYTKHYPPKFNLPSVNFVDLYHAESNHIISVPLTFSRLNILNHEVALKPVATVSQQNLYLCI